MASKFEAAFAAARKSGKKVFSFGGKSYNTKMATSGTPKKGPVPASKPGPGQDGGSGGRPTPTKAAKTREAANYPKPASAVGIARANSPMAKAAAKEANKPVPSAATKAEDAKNKRIMSKTGKDKGSGGRATYAKQATGK